jgi:hypothetical protein
MRVGVAVRLELRDLHEPPPHRRGRLKLPTGSKAIYKEGQKKTAGEFTGARSTNSSFEAPRAHRIVVLFTLGALRSKLPSGLGALDDGLPVRISCDQIPVLLK